jgi:RHS repeat-associated protein
MKTIHKVVFVISILLLAVNSYAGRWLTRDPIGFMELDPRPTLPWMSVPATSFDYRGQINLYDYVLNNPINYIDPLGLDPYSELMGAIARGDPDAIDLILDSYGDILTDAQQQLGKNAAQKFRSTAKDWIAKQCKGSINQKFPDQFRNDTLAEIKNAAKSGDKAAQTAWKLLNDSRFKK